MSIFLDSDIIKTRGGASVRCTISSWWESNLVRLSKSLVSSLGAEAVTLGLSVDKKENEP